MSVHRRLSVSRPLVVLLVAALSVVLSVPFASAAPTSPPASVGPFVGGNGPCPGAAASANYRGAIAVEGGPLNASAAASVVVAYSYYQESQTYDVPNYTLAAVSCTLEYGNVTTNASGGFSFGIVASGELCRQVVTGEQCTTYAAPYAPVDLAPANGSPAGYGLSVDRKNTTVDFAFVADLSTVSVAPPGPTVPLASGGPGTFVATPRMGNGTPSPVSPTFAWALKGAGWSFAAPPSGGTSTVVGAPGAAVGTLSVNATYSTSGVTFVAPRVSVELASVATTVTSGSLNRTTVDANGSVAVNVTATGAAGYVYRATVSPGLGAPPRTVDCSTTSVSVTTDRASCATVVTFPVSGATQVSVDVTNGYANATWISPDVTVDPPPELSVSPAGPAGYAGTPLTVVVSAANGSGAAPYARACFAPGNGSFACSDTPGPRWTFVPTYGRVGNYSAEAWAVDATGANRSVSATVRIVPTLALGPIETPATNATTGTPFPVTSTLTGGVLPAVVFVNASDLTGPVARLVATADGPVSATFLPPASGAVHLTVTAVDALGTLVSVDEWLVVAPGPARSVAPLLAAPPSVLVGTPVALSWQAFDAWGQPVRTFAAPVALVVSASAGVLVPAWVNVSGIGPLVSTPVGSVEVPAAGWVGGVLNLTVDPARAGNLSVALEGAGLPALPPPLPLASVADGAHLRLYDPVVALAGTRTNRTYWHVSDRFGDAVPGTFLVVQYLSGTTASDTVAAVVAGPNGTSGAWVNYSFPDSANGAVRLLDPAHELLYGPVELTPPAPIALPLGPVVLAAGVVVGGGTAVARRRRRFRARAAAASADAELRALAEGRARVVELVERAGLADVGRLEAEWEGPVPAELGDWLASLVADGTLTARRGASGTAAFCLAPGRPTPPTVTLDPDVAERARARRDAELGPDDPSPSERPPTGASEE